MSSYQNKIKKINELLARARNGTTVWWRREGFRQEFRDIEPKWHVLTGRLSHRNDPEMTPEDHPVWLALCGYKKGFNERIFEMFPSLRKTAPKKDTRCRKCVNELPAHQKALAEKAAANATADTQEEASSTQP